MMSDTGYYELDCLPLSSCQLCQRLYLRRGAEFYTNIYSVDAKGNGAGGAFTTVLDVELFWDGLLGGALLPGSGVDQMLVLQSRGDHSSYGYGVWLEKRQDGGYTPYFQGSDPGVSFLSRYDTERDICITLVSNRGCNV